MCAGRHRHLRVGMLKGWSAPGRAGLCSLLGMWAVLIIPWVLPQGCAACWACGRRSSSWRSSPSWLWRWAPTTCSSWRTPCTASPPAMPPGGRTPCSFNRFAPWPHAPCTSSTCTAAYESKLGRGSASRVAWGMRDAMPAGVPEMEGTVQRHIASVAWPISCDHAILSPAIPVSSRAAPPALAV